MISTSELMSVGREIPQMKFNDREYFYSQSTSTQNYYLFCKYPFTWYYCREIGVFKLKHLNLPKFEPAY